MLFNVALEYAISKVQYHKESKGALLHVSMEVDLEENTQKSI
jgi:hypothetical protein